jgi:type VI secretion system secreted protein Hcp
MAQDVILKIDGIKGECKVDGHKDELDVTSFSAGMQNAGSFSSGGGGGSGKVTFQDMHFTKFADSASHDLQLKCADGTHIKEAVIYVRKQGAGKQQDFIVITLSDVLVSSFQYSGSDGMGSAPQESFSLNFAKIKYEYKPQDEKGALGAAKTFSWDTKTNKKA